MKLSNAEIAAIAKAVAELLQTPMAERLAFNITEASEVTGIDFKQISLAIARKELRAKRIGNSYRITRANLLNWLNTS